MLSGWMAGGAAAYTLEALGYPPDRASHKAYRQGRYVRNKIRRALDDLGVADPDRHILGAATLAANPTYEVLAARVRQVFTADGAFRPACMAAAGWALDRRLPPGVQPTAEQLESAVRYFLTELPLFTDTAGIVGRAASVFCYHQTIGFLHRFYRGEFALQPAPGQRFAVITPVDPDGRRPETPTPGRNGTTTPDQMPPTTISYHA